MFNLLDLTEELSEDIEFYNLYLKEKLLGKCIMPDCIDYNDDFYNDSDGDIYTNGVVRVIHEHDFIQPNQYSLFNKDEYNDRGNASYVNRGDCLRCGRNYILCPKCKDLLLESEGLVYHCLNCEDSFQVTESGLNREAVVYLRCDNL